MYLIAGLGNPGDNYKNTRHNIGYNAIEIIKNKFNFTNSINKFNSIINNGFINDYKIILAKPLTYMNNSGIAVSKIVKFYKINIENIIILHDELDVNIGKLKIKIGGGSGGHNGIKSIDSHIGKEYKRVRIGIDHPGDKQIVASYVLSKFRKDEQIIIDEVLRDVANNIEYIINNNDNNDLLSKLNNRK